MRPPGGACWDCREKEKQLVREKMKTGEKYFCGINLADTHPENAGLKSGISLLEYWDNDFWQWLKLWRFRGTTRTTWFLSTSERYKTVWCLCIPYLWRKISLSSTFWNYIPDRQMFKILSTLSVWQYTALSDNLCLLALRHKAISLFGLTRLFCTVSMWVKGRGRTQRQD